MLISKISNLTDEAREAKNALKDRMDKGEISDSQYSIELMKLLNGYSFKVQEVISKNYHYLFTQE